MRRLLGQALVSSGQRILRARPGDGRGVDISDVADTFFPSRDRFRVLREEFEESPAPEAREEALEIIEEEIGTADPGDIGLDHGLILYALTRELEPETVVETGVCNGFSSLCVLLALEENGEGVLHSVDLPYHADESLEAFRARTFDGYGGAAVPQGREPGWIVPDRLRHRWQMHIGKSQRELPRILAEMESIDLFIHDSEHSEPCMMFEYEIAWEWLRSGGVLLSDDVDWNPAFDRFTSVRRARHGRIGTGLGYAIKDDHEG